MVKKKQIVYRIHELIILTNSVKNYPLRYLPMDLNEIVMLNSIYKLLFLS